MLDNFTDFAFILQVHNRFETLTMEYSNYIKELVDPPFVNFIPFFAQNVQS